MIENDDCQRKWHKQDETASKMKETIRINIIYTLENKTIWMTRRCSEKKKVIKQIK